MRQHKGYRAELLMAKESILRYPTQHTISKHVFMATDHDFIQICSGSAAYVNNFPRCKRILTSYKLAYAFEISLFCRIVSSDIGLESCNFVIVKSNVFASSPPAAAFDIRTNRL